MRILILAVFAVPLLAAAPAHADGAWTTYLRAYTYTEMLAEGDTVWCATAEAGLLRFDRGSGVFTPYLREPGGLANNALSSLARDRRRRLWVGTTGSGASRLAPDGASWDLLNRFDGLPSDSITTLTANGDTMWIGTTAGLALWNGRLISGSVPDNTNRPFASNWITGIVQRGDSLWVTTQQGAYVGRISSQLFEWTLENGGVPPTTGWRALATDGNVLLAQHPGGGVFQRQFGAGNWANVSGSIGSTHHLSQSGQDVIASATTGLYRWNGTGWTLINGTLTSNADDGTARLVYATASDESGRVAAANATGLAAEPSSGALPWPVFRLAAPPGNNIINVAIDGPRTYVATEIDGVGRFDGTRWRVWPAVACTGCDTTFLAPQYSYPLEIDRRGRKWFGMWGVAVEELDDSVDPPQVVHHTYPAPALQTKTWASALDSVHGGVWFGGETDCLGCPGFTPLGLLYYNRDGRDSLNLRQDSLPDMRGTRVHGITVDRSGRVWVGFAGEGIQYFDWPAPGQPFRFNLVPGSEDFAVQALAARGDSVWAMTTRDVRIYRRFNATFVDSFLLPSVPARLPLHALAIGLDGTAYVGTTAGLRARRLDGSIVDYDISNSPIAGNAVQAVRVDPRTGGVWIATASGLSHFDPAYVPPPPPPAPNALDFTIYPNPAPITALGISLRIQGSASSYRGVVVDLNGREVHRFHGAGSRGVIWDGRHQGGARVRPGIYFVRVEVEGKSAIRRVAVVH